MEKSKTPKLTNQGEDEMADIKSVDIYIQTELCKSTLENYIDERNLKLNNSNSVP